MKPNMDKIDIVLLSWNESDTTLRCLTSMKEFTTHPYKIIWIDNGSERNEYIVVDNKLKELNIDFESIPLRENFLITKAWNIGLRTSKSPYVVLLNNDVTFTGRWLSKLIEILEANPDIGLISPVTDNISCIARWPRLARALKLEVEGSPDAYFNNRPSGFFAGDFLVSFFCVVIRKTAIDKIGLFCEELAVFGNDDDYCDRIREAGFKTAIALNCFVYHVHRATIKNIPEPIMSEVKSKRHVLKERREKRAQKAIAGTAVIEK